MTKTYEVRIGKYLQTAWDNFLKAPEIFIFLTLGLMAAFWIASRIPLVGNLLSFLLSAFAVPAYFLLAEQVRREGKASFSELKKLAALFPQLLVVFILKSVLITLGLILLLIPGIYAALAYTFAELFVCLEGKTFWDAMESSRKLAHRNFGGIVALAMVGFLIFLTGALLVGVGLLAAMPICALLLHAAFHDIRAQEA
jgi:uncharacterized membrane protein